jgi:hypothetical protein
VADENLSPFPPGYFAPCLSPLPPRLGSLPWACWGLSVPFKVLGSPPLLRLPQVSQPKPPFAWLWNKPLGELMRQQLDQLQRPCAHISVPGQAYWHPAKLLQASLLPGLSPCDPYSHSLQRGLQGNGGLARNSGPL